MLRMGTRVWRSPWRSRSAETASRMSPHCGPNWPSSARAPPTRPSVSRLIDTLAACGEKALRAIRSARWEVCRHVWSVTGENAPAADGQVTVDLDGFLVIAHSDKQDAAEAGRSIVQRTLLGAPSSFRLFSGPPRAEAPSGFRSW